MKKFKISMFWLSCIVSIFYLCFISVFAFDTSPLTLGFFMHLIPSFIILSVIILSWKYKNLGGKLYFFLFLAFTLYFRTYRDLTSFTMLSLPLLFISTSLFLYYYKAPSHKKRVST